jgi:3-oxoadipate enol-lactonase
MLGACNLEAGLPRMAMPAAVMVGDEDYATPVAMSETLHRGIRNSTFTVFKSARHLTPLEVPERVAAELQRLIELAPVK